MIFKENLSLLCDFYELIMSNGYFKNSQKTTAYFEVYFRKVPDNGAFGVFAGLNSIIEFIQNLSFDKDDIAFLKKQNLFDDEFLKYLQNFKFNGDIYSCKEGEIIFPNEPILTIKADILQAQLLETFILLTLNHQCLIATKARRIKYSCKEKILLEFGARRAHGVDSSINGSRSAFIGGSDKTSNTLSAKIYDIPLSGTMAHSWVQMFDDEFKAFDEYLKLYPNNAILLIDTFDIKTGLKNAIKAFKKHDIKNGGVRIDSGDLQNLSLYVKEQLNKNDLKECKIIASNSLDEFSIEKLQDYPIDAFGVGEKLITSSSDPIFGFVYKLVAIKNEKIIPKIKISQNSKKTTTPYPKKIYRIYENNKAIKDEIYAFDEKINCKKTYKKLLVPIFKNGICIYKSPTLKQTKEYLNEQLKTLDDEFLSLKPKKKYKTTLSKKLKNIKKQLLSNDKL